MQANEQEFQIDNELDEMMWLIDLSLSSEQAAGYRRSGVPPAAFIPPALPATIETDSPAVSIITKKQLRALTKKHLLMMIHDLERELQQEKEFKGYLLQAYQLMFGQGNKW